MLLYLSAGREMEVQVQVKQAFSNEYLLVPHRSVEAEITA